MSMKNLDLLELSIKNILEIEDIYNETKYRKIFLVLRRELGSSTKLKEIYKMKPRELTRILGFGKTSLLILIKFFIAYDINYTEIHNINDIESIIDLMLRL